ncbi:hypothetical protein ACFSL6_12120 [Paenibacillus thailandensis]|uniref:Uncharacterized protein n=1 Tax=Paenibacillus thailandensis TaxID=393250 RepID=A0ABW5QYY9_9BACL
MNDLPIETTAPGMSGRKPRKRRENRAFLAFLAVWMFLLGAGISGAVLYSNHMKRQITAELEKQTASQIAALQADYEARMTTLQQSYEAQLAELQTKVDALNELLTFTKDNVDTKTDNSNKLYTQLNEVKKQLAALQKNLEVLK